MSRPKKEIEPEGTYAYLLQSMEKASADFFKRWELSVDQDQIPAYRHAVLVAHLELNDAIKSVRIALREVDEERERMERKHARETEKL